MLILAATALAMLLVPLLGGRLSRLSTLGVRHGRLVAGALALQVLVISIVPGWPRPLLVALHGASYVLAAAFVWVNRRLPGLVLIAAGGALNALAIAVNGGQMPASAEAVVRAGLPVETEGFVNSGVVSDPRLTFLGDVFASPAWLPLRNVYSPGDLLILAGAVWAVHRTCRTVLARDPQPFLRDLLGPGEVAVDDAVFEDLRRERDEALAAVVETGRRNDELRREVARLRQQLAAAAARPAPQPQPLPAQREEVPL